MKKRMTVMLSLCLSLLLLLSACASGGSTAKNAEKAAAALAESMLNAPSEPMQRFGSILESGEESALTAYKDAWEDEKPCAAKRLHELHEEVLTMQLMADEMNETVKVTAVKTEPYEEKDRVVRFTADVTVNDTENMTVSGKCQFDEDGKVSFIELDTDELEMTLIANDNADPTQKPPQTATPLR